jgi:hypothetical protein
VRLYGWRDREVIWEPDLRAVPEVLLGAGERVLDGSLGRLR